MKKKIVALCLCIALAVVAIGGATLAYFTDTTPAVKNTFTVGKVNIELWEHKYNAADNTLSDTEKMDGTTGKIGNTYHIVPGVDLPKDPTVVVKGGSDTCWLFVKVTANGWPTNQTFYTLNTTGWTQGDGTDVPKDVYYREVAASDKDTSFTLLTDNKITVSKNLTADDVKNMSNVSLAFQAFAVQKAELDTAAQAWDAVKPTSGN